MVQNDNLNVRWVARVSGWWVMRPTLWAVGDAPDFVGGGGWRWVMRPAVRAAASGEAPDLAGGRG